MRRARFCRPFSSTRMARPRRSGPCAKSWTRTACSASFLRTAAAIASTGRLPSKVSKTQLARVGRALAQLGIKHIAAYSPEARGRSEFVFRTGCRRSSDWPASRPRTKARLSSPTRQASGARHAAPMKIAWWPRTPRPPERPLSTVGREQAQAAGRACDGQGARQRLRDAGSDTTVGTKERNSGRTKELRARMRGDGTQAHRVVATTCEARPVCGLLHHSGRS